MVTVVDTENYCWEIILVPSSLDIISSANTQLYSSLALYSLSASLYICPCHCLIFHCISLYFYLSTHLSFFPSIYLSLLLSISLSLFIYLPIYLSICVSFNFLMFSCFFKSLLYHLLSCSLLSLPLFYFPFKSLLTFSILSSSHISSYSPFLSFTSTFQVSTLCPQMYPRSGPFYQL